MRCAPMTRSFTSDSCPAPICCCRSPPRPNPDSQPPAGAPGPPAAGPTSWPSPPRPHCGPASAITPAATDVSPSPTSRSAGRTTSGGSPSTPVCRSRATCRPGSWLNSPGATCACLAAPWVPAPAWSGSKPSPAPGPARPAGTPRQPLVDPPGRVRRRPGPSRPRRPRLPQVGLPRFRLRRVRSPPCRPLRSRLLRSPLGGPRRVCRLGSLPRRPGRPAPLIRPADPARRTCRPPVSATRPSRRDPACRAPAPFPAPLGRPGSHR